MRKKNIIIIFGIIFASAFSVSFADMQSIKSNSYGLDSILTTDDKKIITPPEENAMMEGTHQGVESDGHKIDNISNSKEQIQSQEEAEKGTLDMIHRLINWALGMLAFVALVVVMYGGFQMVTAAGDDAKFKQGKTALKKVSIGIIGIGMSRLIVSFFFRFVKLIV